MLSAKPGVDEAGQPQPPSTWTVDPFLTPVVVQVVQLCPFEVDQPGDVITGAHTSSSPAWTRRHRGPPG